MGLEQFLSIVKSNVLSGGRGHPDPPMIDGFPVENQRMLVQKWWKNHWVHQWFFDNVDDTCNEGDDVMVSHKELAELADKLEAWADDPEALPPISDKIRAPFFGVHPDDEVYEEVRDEYRATAKEEAKKIRQAVEWLKVDDDRPLRDREYRYAVYKVCA